MKGLVGRGGGLKSGPDPHDHDTSSPQRYRQTDGRTTCYGNTALCVTSRRKKNFGLIMISMNIMTFRPMTNSAAIT